ncbi:MAG: hypothetical protein V4619_03840 [Bacteroidota bacterium]
MNTTRATENVVIICADNQTENIRVNNRNATNQISSTAAKLKKRQTTHQETGDTISITLH